MTRQEKTEVLEELKQRLNQTDHFYVVDGQGLNVEQTNRFRQACFDKGLKYKIYKNTLIAKALQDQEDGDYQDFEEHVLKGMSGVIFAGDDGAEPAKVLKEFQKKQNLKLPALKGASIDGAAYIGEDKLDDLVKIKSRAELIGEVIGLIQAPSRRLAGALKSGGGKMAGLVKAIADKEQ